MRNLERRKYFEPLYVLLQRVKKQKRGGDKHGCNLCEKRIFIYSPVEPIGQTHRVSGEIRLLVLPPAHGFKTLTMKTRCCIRCESSICPEKKTMK